MRNIDDSLYVLKGLIQSGEIVLYGVINWFDARLLVGELTDSQGNKVFMNLSRSGASEKPSFAKGDSVLFRLEDRDNGLFTTIVQSHS